jgi:predicted transcriptional regulator
MSYSFRGVQELRSAKADISADVFIIVELLYIVYNIAMKTKEITLKTIEQLPENASWEDIQERINFVVAVRKGLRELDEGKGIPHDRVKEEFAEWLTN